MGRPGRPARRRAGPGVVLQFALMLSKCSNTGDFIEACIWASLMRACTSHAHAAGRGPRESGVCVRVAADTVVAVLGFLRVLVLSAVDVVAVVATRIVSTAVPPDAEVSPFALG